MNSSKKRNKNFIFIIFLIFFSIIFNQYYGYVGILPIDSFLVFNSGYDLMNGYYPFKDYWTIKEPFIDFLQAIFFKIFGVSWFSYVLHASLFNCLITISTFFFLKRFNLNTNYCFFYSLSVAILTYPTAGTPFSDHHTLILSLLSLYTFIFAITENKKFYWFITPVLLGFALMSKQAPTVYIILIISIVFTIYFLKTKNIISLIYSTLGFLFFSVIFFILLFFAEVDLKDFYYQFFLYPKSLGGTRFDWLYPFEFSRIILRYKLQYLSVSVLIYLLFKFHIKNIKFNFIDYLIIVAVIFFCILTVMHQLMTINAIFIYCLIPIFCGFSHIYSEKYLTKKNFISSFLLVLTLSSTIYYYVSYIHNRTFMDLRDVNLDNAIDGAIIHPKLSNIKWVTMFYPDNPLKEANYIKQALEILKKDKDKKMLVTDYGFISVFLNEYDYSPTRFWYDFHGYPTSKSKYFKYWSDFVFKKIKRHNIQNIYVLLPLHGETKPLENILNGCYQKEIFSEVFYKLKLKNC